MTSCRRLLLIAFVIIVIFLQLGCGKKFAPMSYLAAPIQISVVSPTQCAVSPGAAQLSYPGPNVPVQWQSTTPNVGFIVTFPINQDPFHPANAAANPYPVPADGGATKAMYVDAAPQTACTGNGECVYPYTVARADNGQQCTPMGALGVIIKPSN